MSISSHEQKFEVLQHLTAIISDTSNAESERFRAKRALARIGDERAARLLEETAERCTDKTVLSDIVEILGELSPSEASIVALIKLVWHETPQIRRGAIKALGRRGDRRAARLLEQVIAESTDIQSIFEEEDARLAEEARKRIEARLED